MFQNYLDTRTKFHSLLEQKENLYKNCRMLYLLQCTLHINTKFANSNFSEDNH